MYRKYQPPPLPTSLIPTLHFLLILYKSLFFHHPRSANTFLIYSYRFGSRVGEIRRSLFIRNAPVTWVVEWGGFSSPPKEMRMGVCATRVTPENVLRSNPPNLYPITKWNGGKNFIFYFGEILLLPLPNCKLGMLLYKIYFNYWFQYQFHHRNLQEKKCLSI